MANKSTKHMEYVRHLIAEYIEQHGVPTTLKMQVYLDDCGYGVSTSTIAAIYKELGYVPKRQKSFVWKHNGSGE